MAGEVALRPRFRMAPGAALPDRLKIATRVPHPVRHRALVAAGEDEATERCAECHEAIQKRPGRPTMRRG